MHYVPLGRDSQLSLPRSGGVAYHAQESWVLNETIRVCVAGSSYIDLPLTTSRYSRTTSCLILLMTMHGTKMVLSSLFPTENH